MVTEECVQRVRVYTVCKRVCTEHSEHTVYTASVYGECVHMVDTYDSEMYSVYVYWFMCPT